MSLSSPRGVGGRAVSGLLLLDKPAGMSSNGALQSVRRIMGRIKAGHTGTLDPMATGLLPLCLGEATKFAGGLLEADKIYEATVRLGVATDSGDAEGEPIFQGDWAEAAERIDAILAEFHGEIEQTPPMFSAIKHRGRPLYEYARKGQQIERNSRPVRIYELAVLTSNPPYIGLRVHCSKGTYVRTLAHDIGMRLGCGAHLAALRRTAIGALRIEDGVSLAALEAADEATRWSFLRGADLLVAHLPEAALPAADAKAILHGKVVALPVDCTASGAVRLYDANGVFLGVGHAGDGRIVPRRMCSVPNAPIAGMRLEEVSASG
jgi:tRNA pseudouridine55 synthase